MRSTECPSFIWNHLITVFSLVWKVKGQRKVGNGQKEMTYQLSVAWTTVTRCATAKPTNSVVSSERCRQARNGHQAM